MISFPIGTKVTPTEESLSSFRGEVGTVVRHRSRHSDYLSQGVKFPRWPVCGLPEIKWFTTGDLRRV